MIPVFTGKYTDKKIRKGDASRILCFIDYLLLH